MDLSALLDQVVAFIMSGAVKYPVVASLFLVMGALRSVMKPIFSWLHAYVLSTPDESDDKKLASVEDSKLYKGFAWLLDWLASVKLIK